MEVIEVPISKLKFADYNPRIHPEQAIEKLVKSIEFYGFTNPVLVQKNSWTIMAGHLRVKAAERQGMKKVPVILLDFDDSKAMAYNVADNRLQDETSFDFASLANLLLDLDTGDFDMELTGFDLNQIEDIMTWTPEGEVEDDGFDDPVPDNPRTKRGDLYRLGRHVILCGDALTDIPLVMEGHRAGMIHTDPPYNVDYGIAKHPSHKFRKMKGDKQTPEQWQKFCQTTFAAFKEVCDGDLYVWTASGPEGMRARLWLHDMGCHWSATIVWKKNSLVLTPAKYQRLYEPCFYGWFTKSSYRGDRKQVEVWEVDRNRVSKLHPTMKPIPLCGKAIANSSTNKDIVLDAFLGSGSTLIACEALGRSCRGLEIDPGYMDVTVNRYAAFKKMDPDIYFARVENIGNGSS